ncbi:MAG: DUF1080 domain-containing protein [Gemmatimonadaceae bacterium]|nr:DUF1080 domain-containing protein [Gemmatimonadaceae bacterium]
MRTRGHAVPTAYNGRHLRQAGLWSAVACAVAMDAGAQRAGEWRVLFDGRSLEGWHQCNGTARYEAADGTIIGRAVLGSPNSFLCTRDSFGDFILEYETQQDTELNGGVQIRSIVDPAVKEGRVHGYQVEIDPSPRRWTGGIYDESRRGWLHTLDSQPAAQRAFRRGQWNHFRVEAIGHSIRTWVNGVPAADILDDLTPRGIIALQVHNIGTDTAMAGAAIRFRNIRIRTANLPASRTPVRAGTPQYNHVANTLSPREHAEGWMLLWDGRTTAGWRGAKRTTFPDHGWAVRDGTLSVLGAEGKESADGGDIVTEAEYENFELQVEYRLTRGANSGIKYFVNTALNQGEGSAIGCEFQLLDDAVHPDAKLGLGGNRTNAGLYDLIPPVSQRVNGIGEWNRARIVVRGRHVEHWLNGFRTVAYERGTQQWRALVSHSKYAVWPAFGEARRGRILLQDHGNDVSFRSIKLRVLPAADTTGLR